MIGSSWGPYPDPLGVDRANWLAVGGVPMRHGWLSLSQRVYAIRIADRFIHRYRIGIPDGGGCQSW